MEIRADVRYCAKHGHVDQEYEDAFQPRRSLVCQTNNFCCAVADGATETSFSDRWASLLVSGWCKRPSNKYFSDRHLADLRLRWQAEIDRLTLPWYAREKVRMGAFAAALGLEIVGTITRRQAGWRAAAVGDSCLFHMRAGCLVTSFPIATSTDFTNRPALVSSRTGSNADSPAAALCSGIWETGDRFYLMTDAIAQWFLAGMERGTRPESWVDGAFRDDNGAFAEKVDRLCREGHMRNDDVTILRVIVR
ncbi:MAG: protein phosphatase 2C domain-containing protein [Chloroflexota bacterium]